MRLEVFNLSVEEFHYLLAQYLNLLLLIDILVRMKDRAELCQNSALNLAFFKHLVCELNLFLIWDIIFVEISEKDDSVLVKLSLDLDQIFTYHV